MDWQRSHNICQNVYSKLVSTLYMKFNPKEHFYGGPNFSIIFWINQIYCLGIRQVLVYKIFSIQFYSRVPVPSWGKWEESSTIIGDTSWNCLSNKVSLKVRKQFYMICMKWALHSKVLRFILIINYSYYYKQKLMKVHCFFSGSLSFFFFLLKTSSHQTT